MKTLLGKSSKSPESRLAQHTGDFTKATGEDWRQHIPKPVVSLIETGLKTKEAAAPEEAAGSGLKKETPCKAANATQMIMGWLFQGEEVSEIVVSFDIM